MTLPLFIDPVHRETSFDLFRGDTAYRPVDWRIRVQPAVSVNFINTAEYGAVSPRPLNSRLDCSRLRDRFGLELADWKDDLAREFNEIAAAVLGEA